MSKYEKAFNEAMMMLEMTDLEPRSALKQAASHYDIFEGAELQEFVRWSESKMYGV